MMERPAEGHIGFGVKAARAVYAKELETWIKSRDLVYPVER